MSNEIDKIKLDNYDLLVIRFRLQSDTNRINELINKNFDIIKQLEQKDKLEKEVNTKEKSKTENKDKKNDV